jgi:hypothetical protein
LSAQAAQLVKWLRVGAVAALLAFACAGAFAGPAGASTWTGVQLPGVSGTVFGLSCPSASLCVASAGGNAIASSTNPSGGAAAWRVAYPGAGPGLPNQHEIRGISCPSPQLCVAVSFEGLIYTSTDPGSGGAGSWSIIEMDPDGPNAHLYGVSCPTSSFCVAVGGRGEIFTSTNPTGGAAAWSKTQLAGPLELRGVSCPSPSLCVAVGDDGDNIRPAPTDRGEVLSSTDPLSGVWQQAQVSGVPGNLYGVSCPLPALCVTGDALGNLLVATSPAAGALAWDVIDGGGSVQITAVDCLSGSRCIAVDNNGHVLTSSDPTGGSGAWSFVNVIPYVGGAANEGGAGNAMFALSCSSPSLCAMGGAAGQVFTSGDPFAESSPSAKEKRHKKKRGRGPKRPRTTLGQHPFPTVELDGRKLTVRFGFFATNRAPVRGFVCKIDSRPLRRCHSPKSYRVGVGKHHFRVRAIGWSGLKGPPARAWFRVCRPPSPPPPSPLPPCWHQHSAGFRPVRGPGVAEPRSTVGLVRGARGRNARPLPPRQPRSRIA